MAGPKPNLPGGFVGGQPKFSEIKMKTDSHRDATFKVSGENNVKIKVKTGLPIKYVTKLTQCKGDRELPEYVFAQRRDDAAVEFRVGFPDDGWYKFQIFALPESDASESLPNVYNYLIEVEGNYKPATPYVKTYTKFYKDFCYLEEPMFLSGNSPKLDDVKFELSVPGAHKVAVHCVEEWFHLDKKSGNKWSGSADLFRYKNKGSKVTVNANYEKDGNSYSVLLEYVI